MQCINRLIFEYKTQKIVKINSWKIGVIFRITQVVILAYLIGWVMIYERGYQATDKAISGVTAKVKGVSYMNLTGVVPSIGERLWDVADYIIPPQQNSAFFILTNMVVTTEQKQGTCPESHDVYNIDCETDNDCVHGDYVMLGNGVKTGRCVHSDQVANMSVCEIYGWCPAENDTMPLPDQNVINNAPNFTVLLKNSIEFPVYKVKRRNILPWMTKNFLYNCNYEPNHPQKKYCPIFRLGDILKYGKADTQDIWYKGGMVAINIDWECDLDYSEDYCLPKYSFRRLDDAESPVAKGWNFRFGNYYMSDKTEYRELIKAYGIQFFITVTGTAWKFDLYTLTMNIGSGVGLFGVASLVCDMVVFHLMKARRIYRRATTDLVRINATKKKAGCHTCVCGRNILLISKPTNTEIVQTQNLNDTAM